MSADDDRVGTAGLGDLLHSHGLGQIAVAILSETKTYFNDIFRYSENYFNDYFVIILCISTVFLLFAYFSFLFYSRFCFST